MYYRFRNNSIQVIRSQKDTSTGASKSVPVGSINLQTLAISDRLRENCNPSELKEIEAWVKRYQEVHQLKSRYAALTLPEQMAAAAAWFETASKDDAQQAAEDIMTTMTLLRRVFARRELL